MKKKIFLASAMAALLSSCGGGGGSDVVPPPPLQASFNMDAAITSTLSTGVNISGLRGTSGADTVELAFSYSPTTDGQFLGQTYKRALYTSSLNINGMAIDSGTTTVFYALDPTRAIGTVSDGGYWTKVIQEGTPPTSGTVGQSGPYARVEAYHSNGGTTLLGVSITTWALEADTATTAWACLLTTPAGSASVSQKECYRIDPAGTISGAKAVLYAGGETLTLQ